MRTRLYLAGPMSGIPEFNYPAFHKSAKQLRAAGYSVTNPADNHDITHPLPPYEAMLAQALKQSIDCHAIALLPGWRNSHGARTEIYIAHALNRPVRPVDAWLTDLSRHAKEPAQ